jgi:hypothetical protein
LGKLQTAYTAAELEAMGFTAAVEALGAQFSGAAQQNAQTYSGKIDRLSIAFGDVKEEIGKGILLFLESLGSGDYDAGLQKLVNFGTAIGDVFRRAGLSIEYTRALLSTGLRIDEEEARRLEEIRNRFDNPQAAQNRQANNPASNRLFLADLRKQQALQKKIEVDRKKAAALAAKAEKERLKKEKEAQMLKRAGTVFDMENIQIVAALQGKIDGEQRLRLVALLAINNDMADAAEKTSRAVLAINAPALANLGVIMKAGDSVTDVIGRLLQAQAKVALLDLGIVNLPKAKNPFEDWISVMAKIMTDLDTIAAKIRNLPSASGGQPTGNGGAAVGGAAVGGGGSLVAAVMTNPATLTDQIKNLTELRVDAGAGTALGIKLKEQLDEYKDVLSNTGGTGVVVDELTKRQAMSQINVNVTVEGSVISEGDLAETITNMQYEMQRRGQNVLIDSIAI